ncbi:hypothetical protein PISL3812_08268 [Talaromyces islandicus]|uniref:DUF6314 domain-containing protein n=1 Tax=Talaromyces islandicus TaxID=28573 RepID=A0A0U1M8D4_TALIS|nr:hypothetical protein PISL3812_08268 [Talaromyces islandicus]
MSTSADMKPISPRLLAHLFSSLSPRPWHLRRTLRSDNPADINGDLTGVATFHPLSSDSTHAKEREMVYREEGEMPSSVRGMAGLRWSKKYIWRLHGDGKQEAEEEEGQGGEISVWFVKIQPGEEQADYLFHEFDFASQSAVASCGGDEGEGLIEPPVPPAAEHADETTVIKARGNHLCIKDMYRTAYAFRIVAETGQVLSWASRHVVKGPKKNQDITNLYS